MLAYALINGRLLLSGVYFVLRPHFRISFNYNTVSARPRLFQLHTVIGADFEDFGEPLVAKTRPHELLHAM